MSIQMSLPLLDCADAVETPSYGNAENRGAIFTRPEVADFILDLAGYTSDLPLHEYRILEPSFGHGDFLLRIAERLMTSYEARASSDCDVISDLSRAIRGVEVHPDSAARTRARLSELLRHYGLTVSEADRLLDAWLIEGDFLLVRLDQTFTHAVGNPPYVRQELIPSALMAEYRARYRTIYDRADLYVPFMERCLTSLDTGGTLGIICSDRWMKNRYGGPLRAMVARQYHLACYVDMVDTPAFHSDVIAYPAITIIRREKPGPTRVARRPQINRESLAEISSAMHAETLQNSRAVVEVAGVVRSSEPWILQSLDQLSVVRRLESDFPTIEETGCKVGIGVATGADRAFIAPFNTLDVEPGRKLPLVTTRDIETGQVEWGGLGIVNPFSDDGSLVDLSDYPRLKRYLETHEETLRARSCARRSPNGWYRTIDRIYPELMHQRKLLIPDIKGGAHIVCESGNLYPHHNLYYITSDEWDVHALQAVLKSGIAGLFISVYSTRMRGDYLRFQAQYLRRIRLPYWRDVSEQVREALVSAASTGDMQACNQAVSDLYRFTSAERAAVGICGDM